MISWFHVHSVVEVETGTGGKWKSSEAQEGIGSEEQKALASDSSENGEAGKFLEDD